MTGSVISSVLGALLLLSPTTAAAQDGEPPESEEYTRILREALQEYDARNYLEARALFTRAHDLQPNARTLRGIGMASFELREYVQSIRALEAALTHQVRPLTEEQRASVEDLMDRARTFVGRFQVRVAPPGATLYVDGAPAELGPDGSLLLDLGEHEVSVRCDDCSTTSRSVAVRGGEDEELSIDASRGSPLVTSSSTATETTTAPVTGPQDDGSGVSVPGIVLLATAGVLAGGAAASGIWWAGRGSEIERCENAGAACRNLDTLQGEQTAAGAVTIGLVAGAAIAATLGVILLIGGGDDGESTASLTCGPGLMGMGCAGTF
jgi:hypothetical protein